MTSTYDTPLPESDLDDDQIRALLASPQYLQEGERQMRTGPMTSLSLWKRTIDVKFICSVTSDGCKKKWTLYQGHQDAQDKQQTADAVSASSQVKVEDAPKLWKFPNRNVHTFGCVYHDTNGPNHGPV